MAQPRQPAGLAGERLGELVPAGVAVLAVVALVGVGGLPQDLGDLRLELVRGVAGGVSGVGGHLGPVQGDSAELDHPHGGAQPKRGDQEPGQRLLVTSAEACDGHMVGRLVAGKDPESEVLAAAPLDLPGGADADGVGIQQHAQQRLGVVGGMAVPVGAVGTQERAEVELVDHVKDEPGEVVGWQPVAQVGRQQERLVAVAAQEVVGHGALYLLALLEPNVLILTGLSRKLGVSARR